MDDVTAHHLRNADEADLFDRPLVDQLIGGRFVERAWLRDRINAALAEEDCRVVAVTGAPGTGKSTLMAWLAANKSTWLRYFIRRAGQTDSDRHLHEGGLASFLTVVGLQLARTWRDILPDPAVMINVYQRLDTVSGSAVSAHFREVVLNPFQDLARQLTVRIEQEVGSVTGEVIGLRVDRLILDASQEPGSLAGPALLGPAAHIGTLDPDQRIVILIDGLDELQFRAAPFDLARWLADLPQPPFNVCFVVFSRPTESRLNDLRQTYGNSFKEVKIDGDAKHVAEDIERYATLIAADDRIARVLAAHGVHPRRFVREASAKAAGNFQYLTFLARTVEASAGDLADRGTAVGADVGWLRRLPDLPGGLDGLYGHFLGRVRRDAGEPWEAAHRAVLGLLAVARAPLTRRQMETLGGVPAGRRGAELALTALRPFLDRDAAGGYQFYHGSVGDFVVGDPGESPYLHCDPSDWHERVIELAIQAHGADGSWKAADGYIRRHLPTHAAKVGRVDTLLLDPRFLVAADPSGVLETLGEAGRAKPVARLYRQVVSMLRDGAEDAALAHLELYARQEGLLAFADAVAGVKAAHSWSTAWTHWLRGNVRQLLGQHGSEVLSLAAARVKGRPIAISGGRDGRLVFWDLMAGTQVDAIAHGHGGDRFSTGVTALATGELPNGDPILVSGGRDGMAQVWHLENRRPLGAPLAGIENAGSVLAIGSVRRAPLLVCTAGASARVWNLPAGAPVGPPVAAEGEVGAVAKCAGRTLFAVGSKVFDAQTGAPAGPALPYRGRTVSGVALGEFDGAPVAAVADWDGDVNVWDPVTGKLLARPLEQSVWRASALAIGRLGSRSVLAIGLVGGQIGDGHVRLFDLAERRWIGERITIPESNELFAVALAEFGGTFNLICSGRGYVHHPTAGDDNRRSRPVIWMWRLASEHRADTLRPVDGPLWPDRAITSLAVLELDATSYVFGVGGKVTWWNSETRQEGGTTYFPRDDPHAAQLPVTAIAVGEMSGRAVAVCGVGQTVRRWDIEQGTPLGEPLTGNPRETSEYQNIEGIAIARLKHRPIVVRATHRDGIHLWDLGTGAPTGAQAIEVDGVDSIAATELDGRGVLVIGSRRGVLLRDLETGEPPGRAHPLHPGQVALAIAERGGHPIVAAAHNGLGTIEVWDTAAPNPGPQPFRLVSDDPSMIRVQAHIAALALVELDGELVAVHSGYKGVVRVTDLTGNVVQPLLACATKSIAIATVDSRKVIVCGGDHGVQVLDAETGEEAFPGPSVELAPESRLSSGGRSKVAAVAVGELDGRIIGVYQGPVSVGTWYLDTGEPTSIPSLALHDGIGGLSVGTVRGRQVVIRWAESGQTIHITDLETAEPPVEPVTDVREIVGTGTVTLAGTDLLVYARSGRVSSFVLSRTASSEDERRQQEELLERGETPPEGLRTGERLTGGGMDRIAMALGEVDGRPVVVAGHEQGDIYIHTVAEALPVGAGPCRHPGSVTAVAFGELGGRQLLVSGGQQGTVCVWDPASGARLATVETLAWVNAVALAAPDLLIVATDLGTLTIRVNVERLPGQTRRLLLPVDVRGARGCPRHIGHTEVCEVNGETAIRFCVKGVQLGSAKYRGLDWGLGHCYVFPGRIVIADRDQPDGDPEGLELFLRRAYLQPEDVPHAYQYDGGHYRLQVIQPRRQRDICCYTRTDRDQLAAAIDNARNGRPKRPFDDVR